MRVLQSTFRRALSRIGFVVGTLSGILVFHPDLAIGEMLALPAMGVWNGYRRHVNILECSNASEDGYGVRLVLRSDGGGELAARNLSFPPDGTIHLNLNELANLTNSYGTFSIEHISGASQSDSPLVCTVLIYRFASVNAPKDLEYALALPVTDPFTGVRAGIFNSISPSADRRPVENYLSVLNPGSTLFSGSVLVYDEEGDLHPEWSFGIGPLPPGGRIDLPLGHEHGEIIGLYRIVPNDLTQPYIAFLARYSLAEGDRFRFGFATIPLAGVSDSGAIPASTMDPALNWGELANLSTTTERAEVTIGDSFGNPLRVATIDIPPRAQAHVWINGVLGERRIGTLRARCVSGNPSCRLLVQSAFYGYRPEYFPGIEWAYVSQARGSSAHEAARAAFPVNTFLGAANWSKYLDQSGTGSRVTHAEYLQDGREARRRVYGLYGAGGLDLPIHEHLGQNITGLSVGLSHTKSASMNAEMIRVYPDDRGGIGTIVNISPRYFEPGATERGIVRQSDGGHWFEFRNRPIAMVGDSISQGWMELGTDFPTERYLDLLQRKGINALLIWSFIGIENQAADERIGYHAPRLWPWQELTGNVIPPYRFSYLEPDGRAVFNERYFSALHDLARLANEREIMLVITIHDGWTKRRFNGHPFSQMNGGPLMDKSEYVFLADYLAEVPNIWNPLWNAPTRHQFILETFQDRLIRATARYPNVIYEIFNEGEWYDQNRLRPFQVHFLDHAKSRTDQPLLVNDDGVGGEHFREEPTVDGISLHNPNWTTSTSAKTAFDHYAERFFSLNPLSRPIIFTEPVPEYVGSSNTLDPMTRLMWGTLLGGGGFFVPNDTSWRYDGSTEDPIFSRMSYASTFFHTLGIPFWQMVPNGALSSSGVCLASAGSEYLVYAQSGSAVTVNLSGGAATFDVKFFNPKTGVFYGTVLTVSAGSAVSVPKPSSADWVLWIKARA